MLFFLVSSTLIAQTAEVTRSGDTWTARVGNSAVYTGNNMVEAVNAACNGMSGGVVNIRNSGEANVFWGMQPRANQVLDFHGNTIHSIENVIPIYGDRRNGITIRNVHMTGGPRYGIWFRGCSDVHLHNITMELSHAPEVGLGIRIDNHSDHRVPTSNLTVTGVVRIEGSKGHGFETYSIDGVEIERIYTRNTGGCGLILNDTRNATLGYVDAYRADYGGGYAGFRTANSNGPNVVIDTLIAVECGRGYFSVSKSRGTTINYVNITGCTSHGMLIQNAEDVHIKGGFVWNNDCAEAIRFSTDPNSSGGYMDCKNNIIENVRVFDNRGADRIQVYGIRETSDGGRTNYNIVRNCDLRNGGTNRSRDLVLEGANSQSIGNALTGDTPFLPDDPSLQICNPVTITAHICIDEGAWQQENRVTVYEGSTIKFGPHPVTGGTWDWHGPEGFTSTDREIQIAQISLEKAGEYVAVYTNSCGTQSSETFTITVEPSVSSSGVSSKRPEVTLKDNSLVLNGPGKKRWTVSLFDMSGRLIQKRILTSGLHSLQSKSYGAFVLIIHENSRLILNRRIILKE